MDQPNRLSAQVLYVASDDIQDVQNATAPAVPKKWVDADEVVFEDVINRERKDRAFYISEKAKGRKRKSQGIIDTYCSLPPWWGQILNRELKAGRITHEYLRNVLLSLGQSGLKTLGRRSGYEPMYFTVHPESETNIHLHFGLAAVDNKNRLLGRSASGKRGRRGLKHAGDCNVALLRMNTLLPNKSLMTMAMKTEREDYDDIALSKLLDQKLEAAFPQYRVEAKQSGTAHAQGWHAQAEERTNKKLSTRTLREKAQLETKLASQNHELEALKQRIQELELQATPDV